MFAVPALSFAPDHRAQMAGGQRAAAGINRMFTRRDQMPQAQIIRSNTFRRALAVTGAFAVFVIALFGFIYWHTDQYLISRSGRMIARQLNVIAAFPGERRLDAIDEPLRQDSRGVQYARAFPRDGPRKTGT